MKGFYLLHCSIAIGTLLLCPSIVTAFEDIIICFFPLGYNVMGCYSLCWNRLLRVSLFAFLDTVLLKHVTFHNNFGSQLLKVSKQQIKLLINCKHRLTIFNKGVIGHLSRSFIRPSIYSSLIVKSHFNSFLEPTSTMQ